MLTEIVSFPYDYKIVEPYYCDVEGTDYCVIKKSDWKKFLHFESQKNDMHNVVTAIDDKYIVVNKGDFRNMEALYASAFYMMMRKDDKYVDAIGIANYGMEKEFCVIEGAIVGNVNTSLEKTYKRKRKELEEDGTIANNRLMTTYYFENPSQASRVISGTSTNGNDVWLSFSENGKSLGMTQFKALR
ncbi:DUF4357 domain-containing protein [Rubinisphaera sp.]|uniref:DUF4357 domain-containing protein n=1 Tax=Rubinisphaera sp. TaxID=2024857 RepID=UPI000C0F53FD|nr:DUF4357 domain-containing protein [Rubinisphaera sp.]MBV12398.1 hypothetical protein [Rubinisphaera sp.]HCS50103.1 hypothetical protein [Planctomycetaceae bacterium]|tara:strand:- start:1702 stop:2262 length:561 start_codon:yes stop_codon:yes gene_type:complete